mmetsp:Transcript_12278/g.14271  ORF Transcript_12278/g.14271 Transcript_12278/m.14271 type:complete len:217 (+) Transcript_12278:171-821(+)
MDLFGALTTSDVLDVDDFLVFILSLSLSLKVWLTISASCCSYFAIALNTNCLPLVLFFIKAGSSSQVLIDGYFHCTRYSIVPFSFGLGRFPIMRSTFSLNALTFFFDFSSAPLERDRCLPLLCRRFCRPRPGDLNSTWSSISSISTSSSSCVSSSGGPLLLGSKTNNDIIKQASDMRPSTPAARINCKLLSDAFAKSYILKTVKTSDPAKLVHPKA